MRPFRYLRHVRAPSPDPRPWSAESADCIPFWVGVACLGGFTAALVLRVASVLA